jgi:hypothetical protein
MELLDLALQIPGYLAQAIPPGQGGGGGNDVQQLQDINSRLDDLIQMALYFSLFVAYAMGFHKGGQR